MSQTRTDVINIVRKWQTTLSTISEFNSSDGSLEGFFLEEKGPSTAVRGIEQRIPTGIYSLRWHNSRRFSAKLPLLFNQQVPMDRYILIHAGNTANDTEGCILPGCTRGIDIVERSRDKLREILSYLERCGIDNVEVHISEAFV